MQAIIWAVRYFSGRWIHQRLRKIFLGIVIGSIAIVGSNASAVSSAQDWQLLLKQGGPSWVTARRVTCRRMPPGDPACPVFQWHQATMKIQIGYANVTPTATEPPIVRLDMMGNTRDITTDKLLPYVNVFIRVQWPAGSIPEVTYNPSSLIGPAGRQNIGFGGAVDFPVYGYIAPGTATLRVVLYTIPHYGHPGPNILKGIARFRVKAQGIPTLVSVGGTVSGAGSDYLTSGEPHAGIVAYARVDAPQPFGVSLLTFVGWKFTKGHWTKILDKGVTINATDNIGVEPFMVSTSGKYRIAFYDGTTLMGSAVFTAMP